MSRATLWLAALLALAGALPWLASLLCPAQCRVAFAWVCHQQPERTLDLVGHPMVVCSRCAGIYAGLLVGSLIPRRPKPATAKTGLLLALGLNAGDWVAGWMGAGVVHPWRLLLGAGLGWIAAAWLLGSLRARSIAG